MLRKHLEYLCDPVTGEDLILTDEVSFDGWNMISGSLVSASGHVYKIINGIPRFIVSDGYAKSFGREWKRFNSLDDIDTDNAVTELSFKRRTGFTKEKISGKTVVEFGCGHGRFTKLILRMGGIPIGIDITDAVDVAAKNINDPEVLFVQGSILFSPFKKDVFDFGFTMGVLHHTPSPAKGLKGLVDCVKPGGSVAVCVYPEGGFYSFPSVYWTRSLINLIGSRISERAADYVAMAYSYFSNYMLQPIFWLIKKIPVIGMNIYGLMAYLFFVMPNMPTRNWRILNCYDAITPRYASTHTPEDVEFWMETFGCREIKNTAGRLQASGATGTAYTSIKASS